MARLTMRRGPAIGTVYELNSSIITIGRGAKNDIVIGDNDVSRNHCRLVRTAGGYELEDNNSAAGTFVNGRRLAAGSRALASGSLIELGDTITLFYEHDPDTPFATSSQEVRVVPPFIATPDDEYYLILNAIPDTERTYPLKGDAINIGRDLSNDIVIQDPEVSRFHIRLLRTIGGYNIEDLGSTNGTRINGQRLREVRMLHVDDVIELAPNCWLRYVRELDADPISIEPAADQNPGATTIPRRDATDKLSEDFIPIQGSRSTTRLGTGVPRGSLESHIFLAYARDDWETVVAPLMVTLQDGGIEVWVEQYLVQGGDDWRAAVEQALHECWLMVLVVSPQALESRHVRLQYRYFINREKPVLLLGYQPVDKMPPEFANFEIIAYEADDSRRSFQRLILEILHKRA